MCIYVTTPICEGFPNIPQESLASDANESHFAKSCHHTLHLAHYFNVLNNYYIMFSVSKSITQNSEKHVPHLGQTKCIAELRAEFFNLYDFTTKMPC